MLDAGALVEAGKIVAAVTTVAGGGYALWRWVVRPAVALGGALRRGASRVARVCSVVERELSPNHGSSIRDRVARIDLRVQMQEARTRTALSGKAYWESDAEGRCTYASRALLDLTGRLGEEFVGWGWMNAIPPGLRDEVRAEWDRAIEDGRDFSMKYAFARPGGGSIPVFGHAFVVRDPGGELIGMVGIAEPLSGGGNGGD